MQSLSRLFSYHLSPLFAKTEVEALSVPNLPFIYEIESEEMIKSASLLVRCRVGISCCAIQRSKTLGHLPVAREKCGALRFGATEKAERKRRTAATFADGGSSFLQRIETWRARRSSGGWRVRLWQSNRHSEPTPFGMQQQEHFFPQTFSVRLPPTKQSLFGCALFAGRRKKMVRGMEDGAIVQLCQQGSSVVLPLRR